MSPARSLAAALTALALAATPCAPCPCAPRAVAREAGAHDCCAPPPGVRAADHACCDTVAPASELAAGSTSLDALPEPSAWLGPIRLAPRPARPSRVAALPATSPPPLVLRI